MSSAAEIRKLLTAEELARLSFEGKVELIDGVVVRSEGVPGFEHGTIAAGIAAELRAWARPRDAGRVAVEAGYLVARGPDRVRFPDVSFVRRERLPDQRLGYLDIAPDLAVEIVSPNDEVGMLMARLEDYRRIGVPLIWEVHPPTRLVIAHTLDGLARLHRGDDVIHGGEVLGGFELPVASIFD